MLYMSCTASTSTVNKLVPNTAASEGGSKSLGEMECMQLYASGLSHTLSELMNRADMCVVSLCRQCKLVSILCDCEVSTRGSLGYDEIRIPYKSLKFMIAFKIAYNVNMRLTPR